MSVLLGHGDGTFGDQARFAVGAGPISVAVADVDGDGRPDLVTANHCSDDVSVLLGRGDGTFGDQARFAVGSCPISVAVADVNGDGRPDLVTANIGSDDVSVLLGRGDGTFVAAGTVAVRQRNTLLVADLDRDGSRDALALDRAGHILWRKGHRQAPGTFEPPVVVNPDGPARAFVVVETADGPRIVAVDARSDSISVYARRGPGDLRGPLRPRRSAAGPCRRGSPSARWPPGPCRRGSSPATSTATGTSDLAVLNLGDGSISPFLGDGRGGFLALPPIAVGLGASDLALGDTRGTGRLDLVVTIQDAGDVRVLVNQGGGPLRRTRSATTPVAGPYGLDRVEGTTRLVSRERTDGRGGRPVHPRGVAEPGDAQPRLAHARHPRRPGRRVRQPGDPARSRASPGRSWPPTSTATASTTWPC